MSVSSLINSIIDSIKKVLKGINLYKSENIESDDGHVSNLDLFWFNVFFWFIFVPGLFILY